MWTCAFIFAVAPNGATRTLTYDNYTYEGSVDF
jgi:hypothetical protein